MKPIIRITIQQTEIDLSSFSLDLDLEPCDAIEQELKKHDFTISGAYILINQQAFYPIMGTEKTLMDLQQKKLSLMERNRLEQDPLRLLRAIKIQLDDPDYIADEEMLHEIESGRVQFALKEFLKNHFHCKQFVTQLNKLLNHTPQQLLMFEWMDRYHIFEIWTGLQFQNVKQQLEHLPRPGQDHECL